MALKESNQDTELYSELVSDCASVGLSLRQACINAGVTPSTVWRWRKKLPKTLQDLHALQAYVRNKKGGVC